MPDNETQEPQQSADKDTGSNRSTSWGETVGAIAAAVGEGLKAKARQSMYSVFVEPLRAAGQKIAVAAVLFASVMLCIVFLSIAIVLLLDSLFRTPGVPYLIAAGLMLVIAMIAGWSLSKDKGGKQASKGEQ